MEKTMNKYKIGIDIGGTNTDVVLVDQLNNITYACKTTTTDPVDKGFETTIKNIFSKTDVKPAHIAGIFVGTTHAVNAVLQRKELFKVGVIRITSGAGACIVSGCGWPKDLKDTERA